MTAGLESKVRIGRTAALWTLVVALGLAGLGETSHRVSAGKERCLLDREPIQPIYRVTLTLADGRILQFGSPLCARTYLLKVPGLSGVQATVTDEVTGGPLPAERAFFVVSTVETSRADKNTTHVFGDEVEARRHAQRYDGQLVPNPFARWATPEASSPGPPVPRP